MIKNSILIGFAILLALLLLMAKQVEAQEVHTIQPIYTVPEPCVKYLPEIEKYPWNTVTVIKIMWLESKCSNRHNWKDGHKKCKGSYGPAQVGCLHYKAGEDINDTKLNIEKAYKVYKDAGYSFKPWSTFKKVV